jgi:glyoxylase-like metal-dependent hydrolase (beta-lactamase superfamily II)
MLQITRLLAPNPSVYTLEGTNTWIVAAPGGGPTVVIDPGPDDPGHLDEVARVAGRIAAVLVTHDHPDHTPGAVGFAHAVDAPLSAFRLAGAEHLRDGQTIRVGRLELVAVHTPGHTSDHVVFHVPTEGALFTGDAVLGRGTSFIDPPDGDLVQYLRSLERMVHLRPRTIYPGHGPVVLDAPGKLREYIEHRAEREDQIVAALGDGRVAIPDIVRVVYVDHVPEVQELAARSVLAHLLKLEHEGRAERHGSGDGATWSASLPRTCQRCGRPVKGRGRYCSTCSLVLLQEGSGPDTSGEADPSTSAEAEPDTSAEAEPGAGA